MKKNAVPQTPELTPMMKQYLEVKKRCQDCILFFRLGDFYEMFFEDAKVVSKELELVLTGKDCGLPERAPMCGVPYHASLSYIARLVSKGYKVALCEQMEDPATAKGIVKRDIVRIYTPGTVTDDQMLDQTHNNYIVSIYEFRGMYGLAAADITTGEMYCTSLTIGSTYNHLSNELARFAPSEVILNQNADKVLDGQLTDFLHAVSRAFVSRVDPELYQYDRAKARTETMLKGAVNSPANEYAVRAAGALIGYINDTQKASLASDFRAQIYNCNEYMIIDASSRRNLEITETMRDKSKKGSLLWVLDRTRTAMGGRTLRRWLEQPLIDKEAIDHRLDGVGELKDKFMLRSQLGEYLTGIYDIERITGKISLGTANARDLVSLKHSLYKLPAIKELLSGCESDWLKKASEDIDEMGDISALLEQGINDDPPALLKEGGLIKAGYNSDVDQYRKAKTQGKEWLSQLEIREREQTGIKNLKVGYNQVFGYYIDVTKTYLNLVPDHYIRKQTLVNNERYITDELKKMEDAIIGAEERLYNLEFSLFTQIRDKVGESADRLKNTAAVIAGLDVLYSFAETADREDYTRPVITTEPEIYLTDSRHPVVEKMLDRGDFVPNDVVMSVPDESMLVITGPNMAGKSTYMRQVAVITLMAQAGSFIPAREGRIGIADKLFTRVGASDDLASGQSTFMVEMSEVAYILANATPKSLLILDEIGRGTSTFDGLSIAWSVLEYILTNIKSRALFATHYHELTDLEKQIEGIRNYCVTVNKTGDTVSFLRKVKRGGADGSYGIEVAALAGIPKAVTIRAKEILTQLESQEQKKNKRDISRKKSSEEGNMDLFAYTSNTVMQDEIILELKSLDVQSLTPIEALNALYRLQQKAEKRI